MEDHVVSERALVMRARSWSLNPSMNANMGPTTSRGVGVDEQTDFALTLSGWQRAESSMSKATIETIASTLVDLA